MTELARNDLTMLPAAAARLAHAAARPRAVAVATVLTLCALGWLYLGLMHARHADLFALICQPSAPRIAIDTAALLFAMWSAMALTMMLPSAAPMILTYAEIADTAARKRIVVVSPVVLAAGYAAVWFGFALAATVMQLGLAGAALLDPATGSLGLRVSGALFAAAGLYQFSSLKQACLRQCRHPFPFFFSNWTTSTRGVFRLGLRQGLFCLGCCWAAMLLMFALGVMNVMWMVVLAAAMTAEKLFNSARLTQAFGVILTAVGLILILGVGL
jgi:predicted metal-binding membrane protein